MCTNGLYDEGAPPHISDPGTSGGEGGKLSVSGTGRISPGESGPIATEWEYTTIWNHNQGTVKVKFTLKQATKAQRGTRGIALLFL